MKKLVVATALLFAIAAANQAAACDMGAIETWVAAACKDSVCETISIAEKSAEGCDGSHCTVRYSVVPPLTTRLTANDSPSNP
jgi:hypothetical protein